MKNLLLLIISGLILSTSTFGQGGKATISGFVKDHRSGEALIGATVFDTLSNKGTVTNNYGFYSLTLPKQAIYLQFSYVGYEGEKSSFNLVRDTVLNHVMEQAGLLNEITIESERELAINESSQTSIIQIPIKQVQLMPSFNGEIDVLKSLQMLPGVKSGNEGSAGIYVRGGGQDENLILVDGVPVYNATHLYGFYSIFNADAINSLTLYKGGFPARYGGRTSSVLDITMKEGNMHEFHGLASLGLITVKGMLEGPIIKDKMSFLASGRTSHFDPFLGSGFTKERYGDVDGDGYQFFDLNFKVNYKLNAKNRIFLSGYLGEDQSSTIRNYQYEDSIAFYKQHIASRIKWGNKTGSLRWYHLFSKKTFSNLSLSFNQYDFTVSEDNFSVFINETSSDSTNIQSEYRSKISDFSFDYSLEYTPIPNHEIRFGLQGIHHTFTPGIWFRSHSLSDGKVEGSSNQKISHFEYSIFLEDDFTITPKFKTNLGIRFNDFLVRSANFASIQPRISVRYKLPGAVSLKSSYAMMQQNVHLLTNAGVGLPTDLWLPATNNAPPLQSHQLVLGVASKLKMDLELSGEVYYKTTDGLIEYKDGASFLYTNDSWEDLIEKGKGESYGLELILQKRAGKLNGWVGYTLSWTNRFFDNLNGGEWFPYRYDSRHDVKAVAIYKFTSNISLSANWIYRTGNAVTIPTDAYQTYLFDGFLYARDELLHYAARNNFRMRDYHRLDLSMSYEKKFGRLSHQVSVSVYNVYNRENPYFLEFGYLEDGKKALIQESLFGIVPSINYTIRF